MEALIPLFRTVLYAMGFYYLHMAKKSFSKSEETDYAAFVENSEYAIGGLIIFLLF